jgi:hypothetical protein
VSCVQDCLLEVGRGRGIWFAPQPLDSVLSLGGLRWLPVVDAEPFDLAVVWADHAPRHLITRLITEVRTATAAHDHQAA